MSLSRILKLRKNSLLIGLVCLCWFSSVAQPVECICPQTCNNCAGGIIKISYQYQGKAALVTINDSKEIFSKNVRDGEIIVLEGSLANMKFSGPSMSLFVNGYHNATVDLTCAALVKVNMVFGNFTVTYAESLLGGTICCEKPQQDKIAPIFVSSLTTVTAYATATCDAIVSWQEPEVIDCNLKTIGSNIAPGSVFPLGQTVVEYFAIDLAGNDTRFKFIVDVIDKEAPLIHNCPDSRLLQSVDGAPLTVNWDVVTASDNCELITLTSDHASGAAFPVGVSSITYTATDASGNTSTCTFSITIETFDEKDPDIEQFLDIVRIVTPDGDGNNDFWKIKNIGLFDKNQVQVVDRWGSKIYSATNYDNEVVVWNGTSSDSRTVPTGTYFYTITLWKSGKRFENRGFLEVIN